MTSKAVTKLAFVATASIALVVYVLTFELRYMWYLSHSDASVVRAIYAIFVGAIVALWIYLPSPLIVAIVALSGFFVPPLYNAGTFARMEWPFAGVCLVTIALIVVATVIRRREGTFG
jgi:hypothetical protein